MVAYYNEIDPYAAEWLENLILGGLVADGVVDRRDIRDVRPEELREFDQCHFFAGIGVWSYALRLAGWPDDRPIWTGSCPCQPFSSAGRRGGVADERHLWPHWHHLIRECRPSVIVGEQVASKDGLVWLDIVSVDMEGEDYAFGAVDTCAAGHGAPHIRQRLYFCAHDTRLGTGGMGDSSQRHPSEHSQLWPEQEDPVEVAGRSEADGLGDSSGDVMGRVGRSTLGTQAESDSERQIYGAGSVLSGPASPTGRMADADEHRTERLAGDDGKTARSPEETRQEHGTALHQRGGATGRLSESGGERRERRQRPEDRSVDDGTDAGRPQGEYGLVGGNETGPRSMADTDDEGPQGRHERRDGSGERSAGPIGVAGRVADANDGAGQRSEPRSVERQHEKGAGDSVSGFDWPSPTHGFWRYADWLFCRDGKWRPVEPGTFPLAHGAPARVGRLRAYGNAIVAPQAAEFVGAVMDLLYPVLDIETDE